VLETTALGAAYLAGLTTSLWKSREEIARTGKPTGASSRSWTPPRQKPGWIAGANGTPVGALGRVVR